MGEENWELPPAEHPIGVYLGLVLSAFILGVGSVVLFISIYTLFQADGLRFSSDFVGRLLLFFGSAYGAIASFSAIYNIISFQRAHVKKVEKEFKDFTVYARPLVEEVIRQRLVSQNVSEQLEQMKNRETFKGPQEKGSTSWNETLILVAILGNATVGLYLYLDRYPWNMVPYSLIFLAIAWWVVIARHFDFINDSRSYYIPAIYVLIVPSLSIVLRGYIELHQVLFVVFVSLVFYILGMYIYYSKITLGRFPSFVPGRFGGGDSSAEAASDGKAGGGSQNGGNDNRLKEFLPPKNNGD
ncbi:MAG: hypothetical protein ACC644_02305 [Candidatus Hydrothermarchaeales archaeon]